MGKYLSTLSVWALSFGSAVGWGAFVMPGTTFLPVAGPLGALFGLGLGAMAMFVIGRNYHYLIRRFPDAGGAYGYAKRVCGGDHGYICGWFLVLTYIAIVWSNATALAIISRHLFGGFFSFGFTYEISGYVVHAGEIPLSAAALLVVGGVFLCGKRAAARVQTVLAIALCLGVAACVCGVFAAHQGGIAGFAPAFADGKAPLLQVVAIAALAPWAFVGFESVSHSSEEFAFNRRRMVYIVVFSLVVSTAAYLALTLVAASACPPGFAGWRDYVASLDSFDGVEALPVFYAAKRALGTLGLATMGVAAIAAIMTCLIGHVVASSRLVYAMARDGLLCGALGKLDGDGSPRNAQVAIIAVSCLIPFLGRTTIGWVVDVTSIGASIAYGYVSYCTYALAKKDGRRREMAFGIVGLAVSVSFLVYFLVPNFWVVNALATESYFILSAWSIIGILVFRSVFKRDRTGRLGTKTVAWIVLLFFIFFSGHMWNRQKTRNLTNSVVAEIGMRYAPVEKSGATQGKGGGDFLAEEKALIDEELTLYNLIQIAQVLVALGIMWSIYAVISRREKDAAKAKSYFFSTISHDIRTPLNAIVGYSQMLKLGLNSKKECEDAVDSILASSKSLLALVNDILDLSRRESGRVGLSPVPTDCAALLRELADSFRLGSPKDGVELRTAIGDMPSLLVDPLRLRHVVANLIANAVKFTEHGFVEVRGRFERGEGGKPGSLVVEVQDTGVGVSEEDKSKISMPYTQVASKLSRNGGTGLGLAVCRQFAEAMGGEMTFESELGKGSTFRIVIPAKLAKATSALTVGVCGTGGTGNLPPAQPVTPVTPAPDSPTPVSPTPNTPTPVSSSSVPTHPLLLLVDDQKMNLAVLKALVKRIGGFATETASDGKEALERLHDVGKPKVDAVLTDMWMPELDGEGLAKAIRADERLSKMPVHVITADVELQENYSEKGFDSIVLKPVTVDSLGPMLAGLAQGKRGASAASASPSTSEYGGPCPDLV